MGEQPIVGRPQPLAWTLELLYAGAIPVIREEGKPPTVKCATTLIKLPEGMDSKTTIGVFTEQVLYEWLCLFGESNHYRGKNGNGEVRSLEVSISLEEMMEHFGYNSQVKDKKKQFRKQLEMAMVLLTGIVIVRKSGSTFITHGLVKCGIKNGRVYFKAEEEAAKDLVNRPLSQGNTLFTRLDRRNPNTFPIGIRLQNHYYMTSNQKNGTCNKLKVKNIISACPHWPTIEEVRESKHGWRNILKKPFEVSMNELITIGWLAEWRYINSDGSNLSEQEEVLINRYYEDWIETMVWFNTVQSICIDTDNEGLIDNKT